MGILDMDWTGIPNVEERAKFDVLVTEVLDYTIEAAKKKGLSAGAAAAALVCSCSMVYVMIGKDKAALVEDVSLAHDRAREFLKGIGGVR